jgi:hypothetical protein
VKYLTAEVLAKSFLIDLLQLSVPTQSIAYEFGYCVGRKVPSQ